MDSQNYGSSHLPYVGSYRELIVYQKAFQLQSEIFEMTKSFPKDERYSLTDQIRRSSRSIGAQIAESWAKRRYEKHFISKLTDSQGETNETEHWLHTAKNDGYIEEETLTHLLGITTEVGKMLTSMISKSTKFCQPTALDAVSESLLDSSEFFIPKIHPENAPVKY